jgi:hypothetical protein
MQDDTTKVLRGAHARALKLALQVQNVLHPGREESKHLGMEKITLTSRVDRPLVRQFSRAAAASESRQLDWLREMLRRPAPSGAGRHMIRIAPRLIEAPEAETDRKYRRSGSVEAHSRSRSPEVGNRHSPKALATSNKLRATATTVANSVGSFWDLRRVQQPPFTLLPELRGRPLLWARESKIAVARAASI